MFLYLPSSTAFPLSHFPSFLHTNLSSILDFSSRLPLPLPSLNAHRGIFHNDAQTALAWVNEEDHCRIISMELGGDIPSVFTRFCALSEVIRSYLLLLDAIKWVVSVFVVIIKQYIIVSLRNLFILLYITHLLFPLLPPPLLPILFPQYNSLLRSLPLLPSPAPIPIPPSPSPSHAHTQAIKKSAESNGAKLMWNERLGFLGTCPSNLGTGLR
jgi:ATP:guanido phosphotransferase, C-terminal catalytic domain